MGNSLAVQWLGLRAFTAEGEGSVPGRGTGIPQATWHSQNQTKTKQKTKNQKPNKQGFPGGAVVENLPANAGDTGSSPGLGRSHMPRSN